MKNKRYKKKRYNNNQKELMPIPDMESYDTITDAKKIGLKSALYNWGSYINEQNERGNFAKFVITQEVIVGEVDVALTSNNSDCRLVNYKKIK